MSHENAHAIQSRQRPTSAEYTKKENLHAQQLERRRLFPCCAEDHAFDIVRARRDGFVNDSHSALSALLLRCWLIGVPSWQLEDEKQECLNGAKTREEHARRGITVHVGIT